MSDEICYRRNTDVAIPCHCKEDGVSPDLTGATAVTLFVRDSKTETDADVIAAGRSVDLTSSTTNDLPRGDIGIEIADGDLTGLTGGNTYYWDILVVKLGGDEVYYPKKSGKFVVLGGGA